MSSQDKVDLSRYWNRKLRPVCCDACQGVLTHPAKELEDGFVDAEGTHYLWTVWLCSSCAKDADRKKSAFVDSVNHAIDSEDRRIMER